MVKILLVDDEPGFLSTLGERLDLRGFDVCLAQTGNQALTMKSTENPSLVLMDLNLPDMNGLEVMELMKEADPGLEVIVLSGHGLEHQHEAMEKGAFTFMTKPVKIVDLVDVIVAAYEHQAGVHGD